MTRWPLTLLYTYIYKEKLTSECGGISSDLDEANVALVIKNDDGHCQEIPYYDKVLQMSQRKY